MRYLITLFLLLELTCPDHAVASTFDGEWQLPSCKVPGGYLADKRGFVTCQGAVDYLIIDLWTSGSLTCGAYEAVGREGNKVDDGYFMESIPKSRNKDIKGTTLSVDFLGGFTAGGKGRAKIKVSGDKLYWIIESSQGEFYIDNKAILKKHSWTLYAGSKVCPPPDLKEIQESDKQLLKLERQQSGK